MVTDYFMNKQVKNIRGGSLILLYIVYCNYIQYVYVGQVVAIGGNSYRFHLFEEKEVGSSRINM